MAKIRVITCVCFLVLSGALFAEGTIRVQQKSYRVEGDLMIFEGEVRFFDGELKIFADSIRYNTKTEEGTAEGNVQIVSPSSLFYASKVVFQLKANRMEALEVTGSLKPDLSLRAARIVQTKKGEFRFYQGNFTGCTQCNPRWQIKASRGKLVQEDHLELWSATLKAKGVPILFLPYLYYPIDNNERKTGFLMPSVGYSTFKGYTVREAFFWAMRDNMDLTVSGDHYSEFGNGVSGSFRYGDWQGNFLTMKGAQVGKDGNSDYLLQGDGLFKTVKGGSVGFNVNMNSSVTFLQNFSDSFNYALVRNFYSSVYLKQRFGRLNLQMNADTSESYFSYNDRTIKIRHLPNLEASLYQSALIPRFLYFSFDGGYARTSRLFGEEWTTVPRFTASPTLTSTLKLFPWLFGTAEYTRKNILYGKGYEDVKGKRTLTDKDLYVSQDKVSVSLTGPSFYKVYNTSWSGIFSKVKHTVEPVVTYSYSSLNDEDKAKTPNLEWNDNLYYDHSLDFSITSRLITKKAEGESPREILSFGGGQSYFFTPERQRIWFQLPTGHAPIKWSERSLFLRAMPADTFYLSVRGTHNQYYHSFRNLSVSMTFHDKGNTKYLELTYSRSKTLRPDLDDTPESSDFFKGRLTFVPANSPLKVTTFIDYDVKEKKLYSAGAFAVLKFQCISLNLDFKKVGYRPSGKDTQILFGISLGNVAISPDLWNEMKSF